MEGLGVGTDLMAGGGARTENGRVCRGPSWVKRWERSLTKVLGWKPVCVFSGREGSQWTGAKEARD